MNHRLFVTPVTARNRQAFTMSNQGVKRFGCETRESDMDQKPTKTCPQCWKINAANASACDSCGADLSEIAEHIDEGGVTMFGINPFSEAAATCSEVSPLETAVPPSQATHLYGKPAPRDHRNPNLANEEKRASTALSTWGETGASGPKKPW